MGNRMRQVTIYGVLWVAVGLALPLQAQQTPETRAPIPAQIVNAKRVFIANAPPASGELAQAIYSGGPYRAYDQFYAAAKSWGRFQLVGSPGEADLVFQVAQDDSSRRLQLVIFDPQSHVPLWWFAELLSMGTHRKDSDELYDRALAKLVQDVQDLVTTPPAAAGSRAGGSQFPVPAVQKP